MKTKTGTPAIDRALQELENKINAIEKRMGKAEGGGTANWQGKEGEVRIIKLENGQFALEAKSQDGWIVSTNAEFSLRTRNELHGT